MRLTKTINMEYKIVERKNKTLVKFGNNILGFCFETKQGFVYVFGKPSQSNFLSFGKNKAPYYTKQQAIDKIIESIKETKRAILRS